MSQEQQEQQERAASWLRVASVLASTPSGGSDRIGLIVFTLFACVALPLGLLLCVLSVSFFAAASPEETRAMQFVGCGSLGLGVLMALLAYHQRGVVERGRWFHEALERTASEYSATITNGLGVAEWLGRHWRGEYSQWSLLSRPEIFRAFMRFPGTSVLIDFTPQSFTTQSAAGGYHFWINILVARDRTLPTELTILDQPSLQWIASLGYEVRLEAGCLCARGNKSAERTFKKNPASALNVFKVATQLAKVAETL